jgi:hypothetical protein
MGRIARRDTAPASKQRASRNLSIVIPFRRLSFLRQREQSCTLSC